MNKQELISRMAEKSGESKATTELHLNTFLQTLEETMERGESIQLVGYGTFGVRYKKPTEATIRPSLQNPDVMMDIPAKPARMTPYFKVGKKLKDAALKAPVVEPVK